MGSITVSYGKMAELPFNRLCHIDYKLILELYLLVNSAQIRLLMTIGYL